MVLNIYFYYPLTFPSNISWETTEYSLNAASWDLNTDSGALGGWAANYWHAGNSKHTRFYKHFIKQLSDNNVKWERYFRGNEPKCFLKDFIWFCYIVWTLNFMCKFVL